MKRILVVLVCLSFLSVNARVTVNTGGSSIGVDMSSSNGPAKIKKLAKTSKNGGSIATASARSKFTAKKIIHGNKVVSAGTEGDEEFTHVDANSVFAGTATFKSNNGQPVPDFTIDLGLNGTLRCKTPNPDLPQGFSLAQMATDVIVDGVPLFSGGATQDGEGTFSTFGDISTGDFTTSANNATIHESFPINFGTLTHNQKLAFFFAGSTLVSYGADVPITFCEADFYNTDTFVPAKKQAGKLKIDSKGKKIDAEFVEGVLTLESADEDLSDLDSIHVIVALGGGTFEVTAGEVGDEDGDAIPDVVLTSDNQASMISAIQSSSTNTVFVFAVTADGQALVGVLDTHAGE